MIFPEREEVLFEIFRCPICNDVYRRGHSNVSCCVLHPPGSCCHYADACISDEQLAQLEAIVGRSDCDFRCWSYSD